jgi:hypothetical protein
MEARMLWAWLVRTAKLVALIGFLLPWVVVSCANQEIASVSGLDLGMGRIEAKNPLTGEVESEAVDRSIPIIIAAAAVLAGLALSFVSGRRLAAGLTLASSIVAIAASFHAVQSLKEAPQQAFDQEIRKAEREGRSSPLAEQLGTDALGMIRVEEKSGYWTTLGALIAAAAVSAAGLAGLRLRLSLESPPSSPDRE